MNLRNKFVSPALLYANDKFHTDLVIKINGNGQIEAILSKSEVPKNEEVVELKNEALVPGFINAHSHAFHRELRGRSGIGGEGADNFWKWRDNMYQLVTEADFSKIKQYCSDTFDEMLRAGITTVGEFHYVHHSDQKRFEFDRAVIEAAQETGIRLVLIVTLYCRSGFDAVDVTPEQQCFKSDVNEFIEHVRGLKQSKLPDNVDLAVAAHSLRAVPTDQLKRLYEFAQQEDLPFHVHLEEQPKEIQDCEATECCTPSELLLSALPEADKRLTAVHCTYTKRKNLNSFASKRINVCICPLTEGFLGDGIPQLDVDDQLCVGTDCNNRLCFLEELRWLAYGQNMKTNSRNACRLDATKLLKAATENGAISLGVQEKVGKINIGQQADLVSFNLNAKRVNGLGKDELLDALIFGCGNEEISKVLVGGVGC